MSTHNLYRIGELAKMTNISPRTIDFYTKVGLLKVTTREENKYRLYNDETIERLERIEYLKKNKNTLEEIKVMLDEWDNVKPNEQLQFKLAELEKQLLSIEQDVKQLEPVLESLKSNQATYFKTRVLPQTAACIEALMLIVNKSNLM
jgi:MerR family transcriptional regulator, copper efflux regulator